MKFKKTIAVVDDEALFRRGFISLLEEYKNIEVLFEAENGKDLIEKLKVRKPEVIFLDIDMPIMNGIDATVYIKEKYPQIKIIILTSDHLKEERFEMMQKGVNAFFTKNTDIRKITKSISEVIEKGFYYDTETSEAIFAALTNKNRQNKLFEEVKLSGREIEVMKLMCKQLTNREIANIMCLSPRTIDTYRENIFSKTNSKNVAGVALYAVKNNIINIKSAFI